VDPFQDGRIGFNQVVMERVREEPPSSFGDFLGLAAKKSPIDAAAGSIGDFLGLAAKKSPLVRRRARPARSGRTSSMPFASPCETVRVLAAESAQA